MGHGGTLDPFAEGVLVIGTNADTKILTEISGTIKSYRAILTLGRKQIHWILMEKQLIGAQFQSWMKKGEICFE